MLVYVITGLLGLISYMYFSSRKKHHNYNEVPTVKGALPIVGHGISFSKDIIGFIRKCYKEYGGIFRIKVFNRNMIVVCERNLIEDYFKQKEENMSMYSVLTNLYFADGFADDPKMLPSVINLVKKTITVRFDEFVPKIREEATKMIEKLRIKAGNGDPIKLTDEMISFVMHTSARCFINVDLTPEVYDNMIKFTHLLNKIVVCTYFFPRWLIRLVINRKLRKYRRKVTDFLLPEIRSYRENPDKNDSLVIRSAVDFVEENGFRFTDEEVGDIIVCLLYVSSENTALGLSAAITDLAQNQQWWEKIRDECQNINDAKTLFSHPTLDACVMESSRLNTHIFALNRKPVNKVNLGEYYVGDADSVALCEPMLMSYDCSEDIYKDPLSYDPTRFFKPRNEPKTPQHIMTWGSGVHLCPGKNFAIYEIKMATALMVKNFNAEIVGNLPPLDYFSPSAFAERPVTMRLFPIQNVNNNLTTESIIKLPKDGILFKDYLSINEQKEIWQTIISLSTGTQEEHDIFNIPDTKPYPIAYHNLIYTGESNCNLPPNIVSLGKTLTGDDYNSLYPQLYGISSTMDTHYDEHCTWGLSINLGASCQFTYDDQTLILNSGDILYADFSKVSHGVTEVMENTTPGWFEHPTNRVRCSIQLRNVGHLDNPMSKEDFTKMLL